MLEILMTEKYLFFSLNDHVSCSIVIYILCSTVILRDTVANDFEGPS